MIAVFKTRKAAERFAKLVGGKVVVLIVKE